MAESERGEIKRRNKLDWTGGGREVEIDAATDGQRSQETLLGGERDRLSN